MLINKYRGLYKTMTQSKYHSDSKKKIVSVLIELPFETNLELQELAKSENITKKDEIKNILTEYLKERKVSELLPGFIENNRQMYDLLSDIKQLIVENNSDQKILKSYLSELINIPDDLEKEAKKELEN